MDLKPKSRIISAFLQSCATKTPLLAQIFNIVMHPTCVFSEIWTLIGCDRFDIYSPSKYVSTPAPRPNHNPPKCFFHLSLVTDYQPKCPLTPGCGPVPATESHPPPPQCSAHCSARCIEHSLHRNRSALPGALINNHCTMQCTQFTLDTLVSIVYCKKQR